MSSPFIIPFNYQPTQVKYLYSGDGTYTVPAGRYAMIKPCISKGTLLINNRVAASANNGAQLTLDDYNETSTTPATESVFYTYSASSCGLVHLVLSRTAPDTVTLRVRRGGLTGALLYSVTATAAVNYDVWLCLEIGDVVTRQANVASTADCRVITYLDAQTFPSFGSEYRLNSGATASIVNAGNQGCLYIEEYNEIT